MENRITTMEHEIENLKTLKTELSQDSLSYDFVIFGLPFFEKADNEKVIKALVKETGVQFNTSNLQSFNASKTAKDKKKCVVHGRFYCKKTQFKSHLRVQEGKSSCCRRYRETCL